MTTLDDRQAPVPAGTATTEALRGAPGSRARSRELGYADAMNDIWLLLRGKERQYEAMAADTAYPALAAGFTGAAAALGEMASYAFAVSLIHETQRGQSGLDSWLHFMWRNREAPQEPAVEARGDGAR